MKRITGAAALAYVVLAAVENMELLGLPGLGASASEVRAAYADTALSVVTVSAGALSLLAYVVFAAAVGARRLWPGVAAAGLAGAGVAAAALLVAGGDASLFDLQLRLRYLAGPLMGLFLIGASRAPLARGVAVGLLLTPLALTGLELPAQLAFAAHAAWVWIVGLSLTVDSVRRGAFLMLVIAAGAVGVALIVVPGATGAFFAWGLKPASLAAFAGGVYVASAVVYAAGLRASPREAHGLVVAAVVLSVSVLTATLVHLEVFDLGRLQAWAWLGLFAAFGATTSALAVRGPWVRPSAVREHGERLAPWHRLLLGVIASLLTGIGVSLWIDPAAFSLPPLGGRFAGSWTVMLATLAGWAALRDRRDEARLPTLALVALPLGALAGALRTEAEPAYLAALVLLAVAGAVSAAPDAVARTARSVRSRAPRSRRARPTPGPTAQT
jgi:hypothetical protein